MEARMVFKQLEDALRDLSGDSSARSCMNNIAGALESILKDSSLTAEGKAERITEAIRERLPRGAKTGS